MVEQAVRNLLLSYGPAALALGNRIHPSQAPQSSEFPALVYTDASRKTEITHDGPTPTDRYGMTLQTYGKTYGSVKAAAKAVRDRLVGYRGDATGGRFLGIFDEDESDNLDQPEHDESRGIYYVTLSLAVWFQTTA